MYAGISTEKRLVIIDLQGRLDAHGASELDKVWKSPEGGAQPQILCAILDMAQVEYLSSAGLRLITAIHKSLAARGGTIALAGARPYCRGVIDMAGLSETLPLFDDLAGARAFCAALIQRRESLEQWDNLETHETECGRFRMIPACAAHSEEGGTLRILGDIRDVLYSRVRKEGLFFKRFCETEYSIGLGGLGDQPDDYFHILGEMITIGGTMVWLPTDGNDTADFMIPRTDKGQILIRTGFNVSLGGGFNELAWFESKEPRGASMGALYRALFGLARKRRQDFRGVMGLAIRARMGEVFRSGIRKSPVADFQPQDGEMVIHPNHFKDWFTADSVPRHRDVDGLICGIGADLTADLSFYPSESFNKVFYIHPANTAGKTELLHNHAVLFAPRPMAERAVCIEEQIADTVDNGEFIDMCHLLDGSTISKGLIGISYTQAIVEDVAAAPGA